MAKTKKFDSYKPEEGIQHEAEMTQTPVFSFSGVGFAAHSDSVTEVDVEEIVPLEDNPMNMDQDENFLALMHSIEEVGFLKEQPLVGEKISGGKIKLISGNRRFLASQKLGLKKVPIIIKEFENDVERRRFVDLYNTYRDPKLKDILSRYEYNARLYDEGRWQNSPVGQKGKRECIALVMGYPVTKLKHLFFLLDIHKTHEQILDLIDDDVIVVNDIRNLVTLNNQDKVNNFNEILDALCADELVNDKEAEKKDRKAQAKKIIGSAEIKGKKTLGEKKQKKAQKELATFAKKITAAFDEGLAAPTTDKQKAETIQSIDTILEKLTNFKDELTRDTK